MPLGVFKAALLGSGAGAKKYWFSALNCGASDSSTTWGGGLAIDTNDEDKVYLVVEQDSTGHADHQAIMRIDASGEAPVIEEGRDLDDEAPFGGVTLCANDTSKVYLYGRRKANSESSQLLGLTKSDLTATGSPNNKYAYHDSGDASGNTGKADMMMMTDDGDWWYVTCSRYNYYGWNDFTIGRQNSAVTGTSMYPTYRSGDSASYKGGTVSYINSTRWAATWVYANSYMIFCGGDDADAQGSAFIWDIDTSTTSIDDANCSFCLVGNDADDVYFKIDNAQASYPSVYIYRFDHTTASVSWGRRLQFENMSSTNYTGFQGIGNYNYCAATKPISDSNGNVYAAVGFRSGSSSGAERIGLAKWDSSGTLQWANEIQRGYTDNSHFSPHTIALSGDEEDLYISVENIRVSGSGTNAAGLFKVPADGSLTSDTAIASWLGADTYYKTAENYTEVSDTCNINTSFTSVNWNSSGSQSVGSDGYTNSAQQNVGQSTIELV